MSLPRVPIRAAHTTAAPAPARMVYNPIVITLSPAARKRRRFPSSFKNTVENKPARMVIYGLGVGVGVTGLATLILRNTGCLKLLRFSLDITQSLR